MTIEEVAKRKHALVRISPLNGGSRQSRGKHWGRGKIMGVEGRYALVKPFTHGKVELVDPKHLTIWHARDPDAANGRRPSLVQAAIASAAVDAADEVVVDRMVNAPLSIGTTMIDPARPLPDTIRSALDEERAEARQSNAGASVIADGVSTPPKPADAPACEPEPPAAPPQAAPQTEDDLLEMPADEVMGLLLDAAKRLKAAQARHAAAASETSEARKIVSACEDRELEAMEAVDAARREARRYRAFLDNLIEGES